MVCATYCTLKDVRNVLYVFMSIVEVFMCQESWTHVPVAIFSSYGGLLIIIKKTVFISFNVVRLIN